MSLLWPHQERAIAEITMAVEAGYRNICVTSPTGGGKSRIILEQIKLAGYGVSLYTDRRMLLSQLSADLEREGIDYGIRAAGYEPALLRSVQLSMMQTEGSRSLDGNREVHPSELIIIDEAHKMAGATMIALDEEHLKQKPDRVKIGTTATPLGIGHFYDTLIVAGNNTELRQCGALVPAKHYGPDEPDTKWIGTVAVDGGECGIVNAKRTAFAHMVFGRVLEHIPIYNPERKPMLLFAPVINTVFIFILFKLILQSCIA